jgi:hypothetical protein
MKDHAHENLTELLRRFMEEPAAHAAQEDIEAGERWLRAYPAPAPNARLMASIQAQIAASARRRHRIIRLSHAALAAAAAVIVMALIGQFQPASQSRPPISVAGILRLPAAVWESDDIMHQDLDLAYYSSQIGQIEAQVRALETDEDDVGTAAPEEFELELMAIQAELLKG